MYPFMLFNWHNFCCDFYMQYYSVSIFGNYPGLPYKLNHHSILFHVVFSDSDWDIRSKVVRSRRQPLECSDKEANAFASTCEDVCTRRRTRSHTNANVITHERNRVFIVKCTLHLSGTVHQKVR